MMRIAVLNHKGGVGKTTVALNLAGALAEMGHRVLLVDCDSQGDTSSVLGDDHEGLPFSVADLFADSGVPTSEIIRPTAFENIAVITADDRLNKIERTYGFEDDPASMNLSNGLSQVEDAFDFCLLDCATKPHLTGYAALVASHIAIVPTEPSQFSLRSLATIQRQLACARQAFNPHVTVRYLLSKDVSSKKSKTCREALLEAFGKESVFEASIPKSETVDSATNLRKPVVLHAKNSKPAQAIRKVAMELLGENHEQPNQAAA